MPLECLAKEAFRCCRNIASFTQQEIHRPTLPINCPVQVRALALYLHISPSQRHDLPTRREYLFERSSNSDTQRCTQRRLAMCVNVTLRSAIIWTRSRELSLNLRYQRMQSTMIS